MKSKKNKQNRRAKQAQSYREPSMMQFALAIFFIAVLITLFIFLEPVLTGFITSTELINHSDNIKLVVNDNEIYTWNIKNPGDIKSIKIDGDVQNKGFAKVYIEKGTERFLIFDSNQLNEENSNLITGLVVDNESEIMPDEEIDYEEMINETEQELIEEPEETAENETEITEPEEIIEPETSEKQIEIKLEYADNEAYDSNNDGIEAIDGVVDLTVANTALTENINQLNLCTKWEIYSADDEMSSSICYGNEECCALAGLESLSANWNDEFYIYYEEYGATYNNVVSAQVVYADYDLKLMSSDIVSSELDSLNVKFITELLEFENICIDTCLIDNFEAGSYKLIFEVEDTTLTIDSIDYIVQEKLSNSPPELLKNFENITINKNENYTINLAEYFADEDGDKLNYDAYDVANISVIFDKDTATIIPDKDFEGKRYLFFKANDSEYTAVSNVFEADVEKGSGGIMGDYGVMAPDNNYVCDDEDCCEYQNLTAALHGENNTWNVIYINQTNASYTLDGKEYVNVSIAQPAGVAYIPTNVTIDCNGTTLDGTAAVVIGMQFVGTKNVTVKNCNFKYWYGGGQFDEGAYIHNNTCYLCYAKGFQVASNSKVYQNIINYTLPGLGQGIALNGEDNNVNISNNRLIDIGLEAIRIRGNTGEVEEHIIIDSNNISCPTLSSCDNGISFPQGFDKNVNITNNIIDGYGNLTYGIFIDNDGDVDNLLIEKNVIKNLRVNNGTGIKGEVGGGIFNSTIFNNTINNTWKGIYLNHSLNTTIKSNYIYNATQYGIHIEDTNGTVIRNNFVNSLGTYDLLIKDSVAKGENNTIFNNSFVYSGANKTGAFGDNSTFCYKGYGNFYGYDAVWPTTDCGPGNETYFDSTLSASSFNWSNQTGGDRLVAGYHVYYNGSFGMFLLTNTTDYNVSYDFSSTEGSIQYIIIPFINGTGRTYNGSPIKSSVFHESNFVCNNLTECEYSNLTIALQGENNTNSVIYLNQSNVTYTLDGKAYYNSSVTQGESLTNVTIDCDGTTFFGIGGYIAFHFDTAFDSNDYNLTIKNCIINDYWSGINLDEVSGTYIYNNTLFNVSYGIVTRSDNCSIVGNKINFSRSETWDGSLGSDIGIWSALDLDNLLISSNKIDNMYGAGIYLSHGASESAIVESNNITCSARNCTYGIVSNLLGEQYTDLVINNNRIINAMNYSIMVPDVINKSVNITNNIINSSGESFGISLAGNKNTNLIFSGNTLYADSNFFNNTINSTIYNNTFRKAVLPATRDGVGYYASYTLYKYNGTEFTHLNMLTLASPSETNYIDAAPAEYLTAISAGEANFTLLLDNLTTLGLGLTSYWINQTSYDALGVTDCASTDAFLLGAYGLQTKCYLYLKDYWLSQGEGQDYTRNPAYTNAEGNLNVSLLSIISGYTDPDFFNYGVTPEAQLVKIENASGLKIHKNFFETYTSTVHSIQIDSQTAPDVNNSIFNNTFITGGVNKTGDYGANTSLSVDRFGNFYKAGITVHNDDTPPAVSSLARNLRTYTASWNAQGADRAVNYEVFINNSAGALTYASTTTSTAFSYDVSSITNARNFYIVPWINGSRYNTSGFISGGFLSPPIINSSVINSTDSTTNSGLIGICNATDADGEDIYYYYEWYRNGILNNAGRKEDRNLSLESFFENSSTTAFNVQGYIDVAGDYAYILTDLVGDSNDIFVIADITNRSNATQVSTFQNTSSIDIIQGLSVSGDYAYVISDGNLTILNISNKVNIKQTSVFANASSFDRAEGVFSDGDYVYLSGYNGSVEEFSFVIVNVSDKRNPEQVSNIINNSLIEHDEIQIDVEGDYAYISISSYNATKIINISDKKNPVELGMFTNATSMSYATKVDAAGDYAYVVSFLSAKLLTIINVTDKNNPKQAGASEDKTSLWGPGDVKVYEDYAYVMSLVNDSITVFNVSDKKNPVEINYLTNTSMIDWPQSMDIDDRHVYVTSRNNDWVAIIKTAAGYAQGTAINASTISSSLLTAGDNWTFSCKAYDGVFNSTVWVNSTVLSIIQGNVAPVQNTSRISPTTAYATDTLTGYCNATDFNQNNLTYYYRWYKGGSVYSDGYLNTNETTLSQVSSLSNSSSMGLAWSIYVSGDYAYVASGSNDSLTIIDIADKSAPRQIASLTNTSSMDGANSVNVLGDYAYVASGGGSIAIIDISEKSNPRQTADLTNTTSMYWFGLAYVSGDYMYKPSSLRDSLTIIDIADKSNPRQVSSLSNSSSMDGAYSVFVSGEYAYVASGTTNSLTIIDISESSNPRQVSSLSNTSSMDGADSVFVSGDYAYVTSSNSNSTTIINITDKSNPKQVSSLSNTSSMDGADSIFVSGDYAYVASSNSNSTTIINITDKSNPKQVYSLSDSSSMGGAYSVFVSGDYAYVASAYSNSTTILQIKESSYYNNSQEVSVGNISSSELTAGDSWILSCKAYDSSLYSSWLNSSALTISSSSTEETGGTYYPPSPPPPSPPPPEPPPPEPPEPEEPEPETPIPPAPPEPPTPPLPPAPVEPVTPMITLTPGSVKISRIPCIESTESQETVIVKEQVDYKAPWGYDIIIDPFSVSCSSGGMLDLTLSVPSNYKDIEAIRCIGGICGKTTLETVSEIRCGEDIIKTYRTEEYLAPELMSVKIEKSESALAKKGESVRSGKYNVQLLSDVDIVLSIDMPQTSVQQPANPSLKIISTPLVVSVDHLVANLPVEITLPVISDPEIDKNTVDIYAKIDGQWTNLKGTRQDGVISAKIDLADYLNENNQAVFAVVGVVCVNCEHTSFEKIYEPEIDSRMAVVMVHGLGSSPQTFMDIINDIRLTNQPWQAWTFGYPTSKSTWDNAWYLLNELENHQDQYDYIYITAHSLGGIVTQKALYYAYSENLKDPTKYTFIKKVRKVILVGVPNDKIEAKEMLESLFKHYINNKDKGVNLFELNSTAVDELLNERKTIPRVPTIGYYVIAGTRQYEFDLGLTTIKSSELLGYDEKNDGLITTKNSQHIGDDYINDSCKNYWEIDETHTQLLDNPASRIIIEKIIASEIAKDTDDALIGHNSFFNLHVDNCAEGDTYLLIGKEIPEEEVYDPTECSCGNNICGEGENSVNCPGDCAFISRLEASFALIVILGFTLLFLGFAVPAVTNSVRYRKFSKWFFPVIIFGLLLGVSLFNTFSTRFEDTGKVMLSPPKEIEEVKGLVIAQGENLNIDLKIPLITESKSLVDVTYSIQDINGNRLLEEFDVLEIEGEMIVQKQFYVSNLDEGEYFVVISAKYNEREAFGGESFKIVGKEMLSPVKKSWFINIIAAMAIIGIVIAAVNPPKRKIKGRIKAPSFKMKALKAINAPRFKRK